MRRALVIGANDVRLMANDPFPLLLLIAMPMVLVAFLGNGLVGGPVHSIPGLAALFGYFGLSVVGFAFYRDHGWKTWDRLRTTPASTREIIVGKATPLLALFALQQIVLLGLGWLAFDMPWRGSLLAGAIVVAATVVVEIALGLLLVTVCTTINQLNALSNLGALLLAGLGGALTPVEALPGWVQAIAPASPVYWSLRGLRTVIADGGGVADVMGPVGVLVAVAVAATTVVLMGYRADQAKTFYA